MSGTVCGRPTAIADVVDLAGEDASQIYVDQRFLDALLAPPVAFDHRGLEQGAFELGNLEFEFAGLGCGRTVVMAGAVHLAFAFSSRIGPRR